MANVVRYHEYPPPPPALCVCFSNDSRTSVLAAANPIYGRYDDLKSAAENIDLMTTILSRFDLIFIVRDIRYAAGEKGTLRNAYIAQLTVLLLCDH